MQKKIKNEQCSSNEAGFEVTVHFGNIFILPAIFRSSVFYTSFKIHKGMLIAIFEFFVSDNVPNGKKWLSDFVKSENIQYLLETVRSRRESSINKTISGPRTQLFLSIRIISILWVSYMPVLGFLMLTYLQISKLLPHYIRNYFLEINQLHLCWNIILQ